jgi:tetratricopeptide (TPR) repeat protein
MVAAAAILCAGYLLLGRPYIARSAALHAARQAIEQDRLDDARHHVEACLDAWPNDLDVHLLAVRIARLRGDLQGAEKHLRECDRLLGGSLNDKLQLERCLFWAQAEGLAEVEPGLIGRLNKGDPHAVLIMESLALAYMKEYRFKEALGCLNMWLEQEPADIRALHWRGWVRESLENYREAVQDYEQVLRLVPDHLKARLSLVELLLAEKKLPEAGPHLKVLKERHPDAEKSRLLLARDLSLEGKTAEAREVLDALLATHPGNPGALYERAQLETAPARREAYLREALKLKPAFLEAHFALYNCLRAQRRFQEAAQEFDRHRHLKADAELLKKVLQELNGQPQDPDLLSQAGELLLKTGKERAGRVLLARSRAARRSTKPQH